MPTDRFRRPKMLVIDDHEGARALACHVHERAGWDVVAAADGPAGLRALFEDRPSVILLDIEMDGLDGFAALQRIRELTDVPVMMVSGRTGAADKVRALRAGADDYLTKPYELDEIVARSEALARRYIDPPEIESLFYDDGVIALDTRTHLLTVHGEDVVLTPLEYRLLVAFLRHPRHVLSHTQLLELAWGSEIGTRDQVKVAVGTLRRKLEPAGDQIRTARGFGYKFIPAS